MQGERKACGAVTFIIAVVHVFFNSMLQMKLFNKMFISLYVIVMKLSGERETVRCAVTTYAVLQTVSPPSRGEFLLLSLSSVIQCV